LFFKIENRKVDSIVPIDYPYPITRLGNEINPKLIILLENPNSNPEHLKMNPEYAMKLDGVYSNKGLPISIIKEYDIWWFQLSKTWAGFINNDDVLALEYYPYATFEDENLKHKEIYPGKNDKKWNDFALNALEENKVLILKFIDLKIPIFVYYKSGWMSEIKELNEYDKIAYGSSKNVYINHRRLKDFLISISSNDSK